MLLITIGLFACAAQVAHADTAEQTQGTNATERSSAKSIPAATKAGWAKASDGIWYYFTAAGSTPKTGWLKTGGKWYYLDPAAQGAMKTGKYKVAGTWYISNSSGAMYANKWVKLGSEWYYATRSGALKSGWQKSGSKWYWLQASEQGRMATSAWITDKNKRYYVDAAGAMKTGWFKVGSDWYYANKSGATQQSGWVKSGGKWYWLQAESQGKMAVDQWITYKGKRYYLTNKGPGQMATGWFKVGADWYYANKSGAQVKSAWQKSGGKWYWLQADNDGKMAVNKTLTIKGALYSFDSNGIMLADRQVDLADGGYGFAASSGAITRIGVREDGKVILKNARGKILTGWHKFAGKWFYGEADTGIMHTGWLELDGVWYYLDPSGAMATGARTIDGKTYAFSSSGAWIKITGNASLDSRIANLAKQKGSLRACFDWVKNHKHTNWAAGGGVLRYPNGTHVLTTSWVATEAARMLDGKTTDCYAYSSAFACLAKALGYDAKVVNGYVPSRSQGWASHSWVEIKQGGTTYVYDPDLGHSIPSVNFYGFTYANAPTNYKK